MTNSRVNSGEAGISGISLGTKVLVGTMFSLFLFLCSPFTWLDHCRQALNLSIFIKLSITVHHILSFL